MTAQRDAEIAYAGMTGQADLLARGEALAAQLERARPWAHRRPPLSRL
jgi:hypothetical protein